MKLSLLVIVTSFLCLFIQILFDKFIH